MADIAHRLTDEKLEEMEKRLSAIYSRAEKEIQQTADEYFSKFAKQDEAKRKLFEQGKITEDEYTKWRKGKVMYGKRFAEMKEQCAKQLLNVNKTAVAYINGELPEVYAMNYNALESAVDGVTATNALYNMFTSTGGTFAGTPSINTTYYLSSDNMIVRETEIDTLNGYVGSMIDVAIDKYADTAEYIIPSSTARSAKKFKITVDDSGTLTATEITTA